MDRIKELMQNLAGLTADELTELRGLIVEAYDAVKAEPSVDNAKVAAELAGYAQQVMAQQQANADAQAKAEADMQAAEAAIAAMNGDGEGEGEDTPAAEGTEGEGTEGEGEGTEGEGEGAAAQPAAVTASARRLQRMARNSPAPGTPPEGTPSAPQTALVASAHMRDVGPAAVLDRTSLARGMASTLQRMNKPAGRPGGEGTQVILASASWIDQYPEDRRLREDDIGHNSRCLDAVLSPEALTASGGICAPVNVDWSYGMLATADRPIRDALPSFGATRGGLVFRPNLDFAALEDATSVWSAATDADPGESTKALYTVACPDTETVLVDAIPTRVQFGNMQGRFDPETVANNTDAAIAAAARVSDLNLLTKIADASTRGVTAGKVLGAMRDLLTTIGQCAATYRYLHRIPDTVRLRGLFPQWVKPMLKIDLMREIGHSQDASWNVFQITDQQINDVLGTWGIDPIWHLDGFQLSSDPSFPLQGWIAQTADEALQPFPTSVAWYFFAEGTFQFLDGGRLDLGVVRDSLLDATNDYETFVEPFEGIANRGFSGASIELISTLCPNGASAGTVSTTSSCA